MRLTAVEPEAEKAEKTGVVASCGVGSGSGKENEEYGGLLAELPGGGELMWNRVKNLDLQGWSTLITLVIAIVAALNSVFGFFTKEIFKTHSLVIDVANCTVIGKRASYTIAFINEGDFPEIIAGAELFLGQKVDGYKNSMIFPQKYCFKPLIVPPKENRVIVYDAEFDIDNPNLKQLPIQKMEFEPTIHFKVKGPKQGLVSQYVKLGVLKPPNIDFATQTIKVDFNNSRHHVILNGYPVDKEFSQPSLCNDAAKPEERAK